MEVAVLMVVVEVLNCSKLVVVVAVVVVAVVVAVAAVIVAVVVVRMMIVMKNRYFIPTYMFTSWSHILCTPLMKAFSSRIFSLSAEHRVTL